MVSGSSPTHSGRHTSRQSLALTTMWSESRGKSAISPVSGNVRRNFHQTREWKENERKIKIIIITTFLIWGGERNNFNWPIFIPHWCGDGDGVRLVTVSGAVRRNRLVFAIHDSHHSFRFFSSSPVVFHSDTLYSLMMVFPLPIIPCFLHRTASSLSPSSCTCGTVLFRFHLMILVTLS